MRLSRQPHPFPNRPDEAYYAGEDAEGFGPKFSCHHLEPKRSGLRRQYPPCVSILEQHNAGRAPALDGGMDPV